MFEPTITFEALLFYLERFILIGALLFSGALLFFLQSAFLFLHSAFLQYTQKVLTGPPEK